MTRKDYILIASAIKDVAEQWKAESRYAIVADNLASTIGRRLESENDRFDYQRFIKACMPE